MDSQQQQEGTVKASARADPEEGSTARWKKGSQHYVRLWRQTAAELSWFPFRTESYAFASEAPV